MVFSKKCIFDLAQSGPHYKLHSLASKPYSPWSVQSPPPPPPKKQNKKQNST